MPAARLSDEPTVAATSLIASSNESLKDVDGSHHPQPGRRSAGDATEIEAQCLRDESANFGESRSPK